MFPVYGIKEIVGQGALRFFYRQNARKQQNLVEQVLTKVSLPEVSNKMFMVGPFPGRVNLLKTHDILFRPKSQHRIIGISFT